MRPPLSMCPSRTCSPSVRLGVQRVAAAFALSVAFSFVALALVACDPARLPGGPDDPQGVCGDGKVNGEEACDDGNSANGDGCSDQCQPEIPPNCGDGILVPGEGEECDDGNMEPGDGCGIGCWIEGCGNGFIDPGEACEDGNNIEGDGCSVDCKSDESCGNGIVDAVTNETCDDGNGDDTDNCPATCEPAVCGDGFVQKGIESCDDGNGVADDGCTECILDSCGDANMDEGEECDQGAANGSDGSSCFRTCITTDVVMAGSHDSPISVANAYSETTAIEVADINRDGRLDVFLSSLDSQLVALFLGKGDGSLGDNRILPVPNSAIRSVLADVNGDDIEDLVTVTNGDAVDVFLGDGDAFAFLGSFPTALDVGGLAPRDLVVAELTGDAFVDVATANNGSNDVTILTGDGSGQFTATARFGTQSGAGGTSPTRIAIGDITGDGVADIVTANGSSDVAVLEALGGGSFAAPEIHSTVLGAQGVGTIALVLADVTNDGKVDVVTANNNSSDVTVLAQQGGTLASPLAFPTFSGDEGTGPFDLAVADINKDGVPDLVTANSADISIIPGLGAGVAFGPPAILSGRLVEGESLNLRGLSVADMNADNVLDVLAANASSGRDIRVFLGNGTTTPESVQAFQVDADGASATTQQTHVRDLDGDGHLDVLALTNRGMITISGDGQGRLLPSLFSPSAAISAALGDFDDDGDLDYMSLLTPNASNLRIGGQEASGRFTGVSLTSPSTSVCTDYATGDFDGNGTIDAVGLSGSEVILFSGVGDRTFAGFTPISVTLTGTGRAVTTADISGDGDLDIITVTSTSEVNVMIGNGSGGFTNPTPISTEVGTSGRTPFDVAIADIDGEMGPDLITANASTQDLSVILSTGSGTFAPAKVVPAVFGAEAASVRSVAAGDFNGDGLMDLVSANLSRSTISIIIGFGNGNFAAPQTFETLAPSAVAVGDFDGDGLDDVAVGNQGIDSRIGIFLGKGHP